MTVDKVFQYDELVKRINECGMHKHCNGLSSCEECNEVNLWSYWVGGRSNLNAAILVVGQDWGQKSGKEYLSAIKRIAYNCNPYYRKNHSKTNDRLCRLFASIGYNISQDDGDDGNDDGDDGSRPLTDLFFTNFVACYREKGRGNSGNFDSKWLNNCTPHFQELVGIIHPKIILCLGKRVYQGVCNAAEPPFSSSLQNYNNVIAHGAEPMTIKGVDCTVFPLAHPGALGTLNRSRSEKKSKGSSVSGESLQMDDWQKIGKAMKKADS